MGNTLLAPDHLHAAVNHLPLVGLLAAALPLLYALVRRETHTLLVGFAMCLIFGASVALVMGTGEEAEEDIDHGSRLSNYLDASGREWLHGHEERAEKAALTAYAAAVVGALGLIALWKMPRFAFPLGLLALILCFVSVMALAWVAQAGGRIHHPEFRTAPAVAR